MRDVPGLTSPDTKYLEYLEFNLEGDIHVVKLNKHFMNVKKRVWDEREKRSRDLQTVNHMHKDWRVFYYAMTTFFKSLNRRRLQ